MEFVNLTTFEITSLIWPAPILSALNQMNNAFEVSKRSTATHQLFLKNTFYGFGHPFTFAFQLIFTLALLLIIHKIVYNIFVSPLRNIPGPFLAKITTKWLTLNEVAGNRSFVVAKAHEKYGPIIRTGPDELSFSDRACIKDIYLQGSKFPKSRRYEGFASGTRASFDMTHPYEHRERRNLLRHVLAPSNVDEAEPLIGGAVRKSLRWVRRAQEGRESLDVMLWMRRIMLDTGGALFLGRDFGALENDEVPELLEWVDDLFAVFALNWFAPWIKTVLKYLPIPSVQFFLDSQRRCYAYGRKLFDEYIKQYGRYSGRIDLLTKMVGTPDSHPLSDEAICDELASLLLGAVDTTVVVATWMLWELAQHPEWQTKIREELRANTIEFQDGVPANKNISSLPTLHGFIMESMRLHPAQSIGLPRVAGTDNTTIGGFAVPKGTSVSLQSRNVHRDPATYPSPHSFHPERWISTNGGTKPMKDSFIAFSKGSRACLGQYVAFMELKLVVASLINGWSVSISEETTEKVMRQQDYFLAFPMERKCWLKFDRVKTSGDGGVVRLAPRI